MKTIAELKREIEATPMSENDKRLYSDELKKNVVEYIMSSGKRPTVVSRELGLADSVVWRWMQKYRNKNNKVAYLHGTRPRMDIATKCIAVKRYLEDGATLQTLAEEYHVSPQTVNNWVDKYKKNYDYLIENLEPGVVQMKEEQELLYGEKAIREVVALKESQIMKLKMFIDIGHEYGYDKRVLKKAANDANKSKEEKRKLEEAIEIIEASKVA